MQKEIMLRLWMQDTEPSGIMVKDMFHFGRNNAMFMYYVEETVAFFPFIAFCTEQGACRNCSDTEVRMSLYLQHRSLL